MLLRLAISATALQSIQARFDALDIIAKRVDRRAEFFNFVAAGHVAAGGEGVQAQAGRPLAEVRFGAGGVVGGQGTGGEEE